MTCDLLKDWKPEDTHALDNGWAICFPADGKTPVYCFGKIPADVLKQTSNNQSFIYLLEAWLVVGSCLHTQRNPFLLNEGSTPVEKMKMKKKPLHHASVGWDGGLLMSTLPL